MNSYTDTILGISKKIHGIQGCLSLLFQEKIEPKLK